MTRLTALLAITCLAATPAAGGVREAAFASSSDQTNAKASLFVGASYRLGFDRAAKSTKGRASLKMSGMTHRPATSELRFGQGIEFAAGRTGKPALFLAGSDVGELQKSARLNGTTTAVVAVVGVALLVGVVFLATHCDNDCDNARNE